MMNYTIEQPTDLPAPTIMVRMLNSFSLGADIPSMINTLDAQIAKIKGERVFLILDMTEVTLNLSEIIQGMGAVFVHSDLNTTHMLADRVTGIWIGSGLVLRLAAGATNQDQYGNRHTELVETLDEALAYIRAECSARAA